MKKGLVYLKVIGLTIITCGLYGAWWVFCDFFSLDNADDDLTYEEKKAQEIQRAASAAFLTQTFNKP